jgi:hypothetical protein
MQWARQAERLARPVLEALAAGRLRSVMPVEHHRDEPQATRCCFTHLEAVGRLLAGIAPWLTNAAEPVARELGELARRGIETGVDPQSPDSLNFCQGAQPVVDAAFLAHAILRAPALLWHPLPATAQRNLVAAMKSSRRIKPGASNWLLFSAMVEAFLALAGEPWDAMRVDYALRQHEQWYKGDGAYGDGPRFHFDYYNSFVIQPMLLDVLAEVGRHRDDWKSLADPVLARAQRYAIVLERLIAPDGSFPAIGRSLAYRCGAFQLLAQLALQQKLPPDLPPGQVRAALSAVINRTLEAPGTFDDAGWLRIGLCGHQPSIGEKYISTGSLYLCSTALLPLGLGAEDEFWQAPGQAFTGQSVWAGEDIAADHALHE